MVSSRSVAGSALLAALVASGGCSSDVCDGDEAFQGSYFIASQGDLDDIEGFRCITGSLIVGPMEHDPDDTGSGIQTDDPELSPFVINLDGLEDLEVVEGDVHIAYNALLVDIGGLSGLAYVGREVRFQKYPRGDLIIHQNPVLTDLDGLESLYLVGANLIVSHNTFLSDIDGMSSLERVGWEMKFEENPNLDTADIESWADGKAAVGGLVLSGNGGSGGE